MTLDEFIKNRKITPENIEEFIKQAKRTWEGCCGGDTDYQCSPKGVKLNAIIERNHPDRNIKEIFYKWEEVRAYVTQPQQITLW